MKDEELQSLRLIVNVLGDLSVSHVAVSRFLLSRCQVSEPERKVIQDALDGFEVRIKQTLTSLYDL